MFTDESTAAGVVRTEIHGDDQTTTSLPLAKDVRIEFDQPDAGARLVTFRFLDARTRGPVRRTDVWLQHDPMHTTTGLDH